MLSLFIPILVALIAAAIGYEIGRQHGFEEGRWEDVTPEEFATLVYDHERDAQ